MKVFVIHTMKFSRKKALTRGAFAANTMVLYLTQKYLLGQIFLGHYYNDDSRKNQGGILGKTMTQNTTKNDKWEQCDTKHNALKI